MKPNIAKLMIILATLFLCAETASAFYDPGLQRWVNRDPIEEHGGITLFRFVDNNPINALDQFGECPLANPANAEAYAGKPGSSAGVSAGQAIGFMAGSIAANAIAATGLGLTLEALGPPLLGWLGLGGAAASNPQVQAELQPMLAAINQTGQVILNPNLSLSHQLFAQQVLGIAGTQLPPGTWVGTVGTFGGQVAALNSMTFFGNQAVANPQVQQAIQRACSAY